MIWVVPIIGPIIGFVLTFFLAIPLWWLWNMLAPTYFYWLPQVYLQLPFWDVVGLCALVFMLRLVLLPRFGTDVKVNKEK